MNEVGIDLNRYKNIIFDLGGVIVNLDYAKTVSEFKKYLPNLDETVFFGKENQLSFFSDYEMGRIDTKNFREEFFRFFNVTITDKEFKNCWNAMIFDFPLERITLIENLKKLDKNIFLLSNINELHEEAVEERFKLLNFDFQFQSLFTKHYYSHRIGLRKPNSDVFHFVLKDNSLNPHETLFIDDSLHHVLGARECGISAIHLERPQRLEELEIFKRVLTKKT